MADLTVVATAVAAVKVVEDFTLPTSVQVNAGQVVYLVAATGKAALADEDGLAPLNAPRGVAIRSGRFAGDAITFMKRGYLDLGAALDALDFGAKVYLSDTAGLLADADPGAAIVVGVVWPAFGNTAADRLLYVDL